MPGSEFEEAYPQLRALAQTFLSRVSGRHTLQATALVHEVYLKLNREPRDFQSRVHFVSTAALVMKQVLVDHARTRGRQKRGGELMRVTLDGFDLAQPDGVDVLELTDAIGKLAAIDARQAHIVELRFFMGLSVDEVAELLDVSPKTVKRDWSMARAWLQRALRPGS